MDAKKVFIAVGHFFKHCAVGVSEAFVAIFGSDAAHTFAVGAESMLKSALGVIVTEVVAEVQNVASGVDKRGLAFDKISITAKSAGIQAGDSIINMLIELAVNRLKGAFGPAAQ